VHRAISSKAQYSKRMTKAALHAPWPKAGQIERLLFASYLKIKPMVPARNRDTMIKHLSVAALLVASMAFQTAGARTSRTLASNALVNIGRAEALHITGTEPFWGGQVRAGRLTFETPDNAKGETFRVRRTVRPRSVTFNGTMSQGAFEMVVIRKLCSDGMSDRDFPYEVTIIVARDTLHGCGWTARRPYKELPPGQ
jgi:uncharacterized membrane protein